MTTKLRTLLTAITFLGFAATATASFGDTPKVPESTAEHEALAKKYREEAVTYRKTATEHKEMEASYKNWALQIKGTPSPWVKKMSKHCAQLAKDAEKLAVDADKAAEYHTLRGKELQGK